MDRLRRNLPRLSHVALLTPLFLWAGHEAVDAHRLRGANAELLAQLEAQGIALDQAAACEAGEVQIVEVRRSESLTCPTTEPEPEPAEDAGAAASQAGPEAPGGFAFVNDDRLVLDSAAEMKWMHGELRGDASGDSGSYWAERDTYLGDHAGFEDFDGAEFNLYGEEDQVCRVKVGKAYVRGEITGELGLSWDSAESDAYYEYLERVSEGKSLRTQDKLIESLARERILLDSPARLEVEFEVVEGDCAQALWGRAASLGAPTVWRQDAGADQLEALREQVRGSEPYKKSRRDFERDRLEYPESFGSVTWSGHEANTMELVQWAGPAGRSLAFVTMGWTEECGGPDTRVELQVRDGALTTGPGEVDALFTLAGQDYVLRYDGSGDGFLLALDEGVDEDGFANTRIVSDFVIQYYGCPC